MGGRAGMWVIVKNQQIREEDDEEEESSCEEVGEIRMFQVNNSTPLIDVEVSPMGKVGKTFIAKALPDTGCTECIIFKDLIMKNGFGIHDKEEKKISAANGTSIPCLGVTFFLVKYKDQVQATKAYVIDGMHGKLFLSWKCLIGFKIIPENFPTPMKGPQNKKTGVAINHIMVNHNRNQVRFDKDLSSRTTWFGRQDSRDSHRTFPKKKRNDLCPYCKAKDKGGMS